ncbi:MAG TPA: pitrilysin family protein, partial [Oligoflexus sp.]|uniref:M16 family metallopeptidase n=1 Tax=Oligoflexus sp. TaxID=1971216 RepID=UPI002D6842A5
MTSDKILRASIFILAFLVGLLRENVAHGKESWQVRHEVEGIREYQLQNGLKVLLFPDHSKATITVNMTYFVGSRHEGYGEAGMAHLLEHMLFRSTRTRTHIMQLLEEKSGDFNGMTWPDGTLYYETLPATPDNLEFALSLEADRMLNSRITADELRTEFSVVRNEFEMDENNPQDVLREQMLGVAYQWHGYGRATIGNKSDIENVSAERLREFYKRYYQTDNAMLIVAGQFEEADAKKLIEKYFSPMPKPQRPLQATYTTEPVQEGERQLTIRRAGDQATVGLMYHTVAGGHPEAAAVAALVAMLAEQPQGLLYKELVEEGLASEVEGSIWNAAEPGVISFFAKAAKGQKPEKLALRMIEILETLQPDQLNLAHLKRYQQHASRNFTLSFNSNETAVNLSEWAAMGDWRLFFANRDSV